MPPHRVGRFRAFNYQVQSVASERMTGPILVAWQPNIRLANTMFADDLVHHSYTFTDAPTFGGADARMLCCKGVNVTKNRYKDVDEPATCIECIARMTRMM